MFAGICLAIALRLSAVTRVLTARLAVPISRLRNILFVVMTLNYGVTTTDVLELINCQPFEGREGQWLASHPYVQCFGDDHRVAGILAWTTLGGFCVLYPVWTLILISAEKRRRARAKHRSAAPLADDDVRGRRVDTWSRAEHTALAHFLNNGYLATKAFFHELNMVLILALASTNAVLDNGVRGTSVKMAAIVCFLVLLLHQRPYAPGERWKLHVKTLSLVVVAEASILNCVATKSAERTYLKPAVQVLSVFLAALCVLLCLVLCFGYGHFLRSVAAASKKEALNQSDAGSDIKEGTKANDEVLNLELTVNPMMGAHSSSQPDLLASMDGSHRAEVRIQKMKHFRDVGAEHFDAKTLKRGNHRRVTRKAFDLTPKMVNDDGEETNTAPKIEVVMQSEVGRLSSHSSQQMEARTSRPALRAEDRGERQAHAVARKNMVDGGAEDEDEAAAVCDAGSTQTEALPIGWLTASSQGVTYYYHESTQETSWTRPTLPQQ